MLVATFGRQGKRPSHPLTFFTQLINLLPSNCLICLTANLNGKNIANAIFLIDGCRMLYLSGTATQEGMRCAANSLIQWEALKYAVKRGLTDYDMGGIGISSIDRFKASFGGYAINHHRWIYRSRIFRLLEPLALLAIRYGIIQIRGSRDGES
jgi:lipid II:glycine glycyltransferase (peptidoglycan interpeptide bridge formation enzyme)